MSIGELLIVSNIVRNGRGKDFEKEVISHKNNKILIARSMFSYLKAHKFVQQGCFLFSSFSRNFDGQFSSNFHRLVVSCVCRDTPIERTGL